MCQDRSQALLVVLAIASLFLGGFASSPLRADETATVIRGRVIDETGKPIVGADVGGYWSNSGNGGLMPSPWRITDDEGRFEVPQSTRGPRKLLFAASDDRRLGGLAWLDDDVTDVEIVARPLVRLSGEVACPELPTPIRSFLIDIRAVPHTAPDVGDNPTLDELVEWVKQGSSLGVATYRGDRFEVHLPAGRYLVRFSSRHREDEYHAIELRAVEGTRELAPVEMKLETMARLLGKPSPEWHISDARGVPPDTKVSDFRGKWLLIEFWGYWCGPCIAGSLPELIQTYEDLADHRDKFEIVAVHHDGAGTLEELEEKLPEIRKKYWRGEQLPFPVIVDATSQSVEAFGVRGFPSAFLIDPEGNVAPFRGPQMFAELVRGELTLRDEPLDGPVEPPRERGRQIPLAENHIKSSQRRQLEGHSAGVDRFAYHAASDRLVSIGNDLTYCVWKAGEGRLLASKSFDPGVTFSSRTDPIELLPERSLLLTTGTHKQSGRIRLLSLDDLTVVETPLEFPTETRAIDLSADGRRLAVVTDDNYEDPPHVAIFDTSDWSLLQEWDALQFVRAVELSPNGERIALSGRNVEEQEKEQVWLRDVQTREIQWTVDVVGVQASMIAFSPDGKEVVVPDWSDELIFRDATDGTVLAHWDLPGHQVISIDYSADGKRIITGSSWPAAVCVWDRERERRLATYIGHDRGRVKAVQILRDGSIVSGGGMMEGEAELNVWLPVARQARAD